MSEIPLEEAQISRQALEEISRLFDLYRIARLNVRYYGHRAEHFSNYQRNALIGIAVLSAAALSILLAEPSRWLKIFAMICASAAATGAAVLPTLGWSECVRDLHVLYVAYGILFGQIETVIGKIKRSRDLTPELMGASLTLQDTFHYLETLDERSQDHDAIARFTEQVNREFPPDYGQEHL